MPDILIDYANYFRQIKVKSFPEWRDWLIPRPPSIWCSGVWGVQSIMVTTGVLVWGFRYVYLYVYPERFFRLTEGSGWPSMIEYMYTTPLWWWRYLAGRTDGDGWYPALSCEDIPCLLMITVAHLSSFWACYHKRNPSWWYLRYFKVFIHAPPVEAWSIIVFIIWLLEGT